MSDYEKKRLDADFKKFTNQNFETPSNCRNIDQIRFYVKELCGKIDEYEKRFSYVPGWAYTLLAQYNLEQNKLLYVDFQRAYAV